MIPLVSPATNDPFSFFPAGWQRGTRNFVNGYKLKRRGHEEDLTARNFCRLSSNTGIFPMFMHMYEMNERGSLFEVVRCEI